MVALLAAAGCTETGMSGAAQAGELPESVVSLAAPGQNLATARLVPEDNCYWYEHSGPVETTLLPLRTPQGNPICVSAPS